MKKILRMSLLLVLALGIIGLTSKVEAKNYGIKTVYLKVGESVTLGQKDVDIAPDIPYENNNGYIENGNDIRNYRNGAFNVEVGKETKDRTIKITGVKEGTGTLIVKFHPTGSSIKTDKISFRVSVTNIPVKEVLVTTRDVELKPNEGKQLAASISPSNATNKDVVWSILSGGEYVSVTPNGYVTAKDVKRSGEALIQVRTKDNDKSAACTVKVKATGTTNTTTNNTTNNANTTNTTNTSTNTTNTTKNSTNTTKTSTNTINTSTNNDVSRHNTNTKPQIGNEYLKVNDKIKFTATSWYLYSKDTLAKSTTKQKTLKNGDICIVKSISGNAVQVTDESNKDLGYIYWNNTSTGAKSNFVKVSSGNSTDNKSTQKGAIEDCSSILKLFSNVLQKVLPTAIDATKIMAANLLKKGEEIIQEKSNENTSKEIMYGDVYADKKVDSKDATYLARYIAGWENYNLDEQAKIKADVNLDGKIDEKDVEIIKGYVIGKYTSLPVKEGTSTNISNELGKIINEDSLNTIFDFLKTTVIDAIN